MPSRSDTRSELKVTLLILGGTGGTAAKTMATETGQEHQPVADGKRAHQTLFGISSAQASETFSAFGMKS